MKLNTIYNLDALTGLRQLDSQSIHCCVTSPPYYGLRDYGSPDQIGLEGSPEEYITRLVEVFREVKRVLRDDGTLWINIGDSYAGSGKGAGKYPDTDAKWKQNTNKGSLLVTGTNNGRCKPKDMIGIPWMLAFALRDNGWYLRQDIIWAKPNPMPESVIDRCTKSHEYIFLFSKRPRYYFDAEAIAEPVAASTVSRVSQDLEHQAGSDRVPGKTNGAMKAVLPRYGGSKYTATPDEFNRTKSGNAYDCRPMRNKRDVWTVTTKPFKGAHFATFPPDLIEPCILAGCPKGGIVLDPFAGSGTVGLVAEEHERYHIGFDTNPAYCDMANARIFDGRTLLNWEVVP